MQMPAPVGSRGDVGIHLQLSMQVVLTKLIAQEEGTWKKGEKVRHEE